MISKVNIIDKMKHLQLQYDDKFTDETYNALPSSRYDTIAEYVIQQIKTLQDELDEIKGRSCGSCKHWSQEDISVGICTQNDQFNKVDNYKSNNQYCSEWEQK